MPARVQGQEQRASEQWKSGRTAAVRRRPSATDPGIRDGTFPQARKATPAAHQGANLMEEAEPPKENVDPKRFSWLECEPLPLPQLREGRGAVPSRGDVIEAKIAGASGRAAGESVMLKALEVSPRKRREFSREWFARGSSTRSSQTTPFRSLVWGRSGRSSWFTTLLGRSAFVIVHWDEVCHVDEILKVMDDEQRARTRDDRPPDLDAMSLAEAGLALKSHLLARGASKQRRW